MVIIPGHPDEIKLLNMQKEASVAILNLTIKADEARFRVRSEQGIVAILDEVRRMRNTVLIDIEPEETAPIPLLQ